MQSTGEIRTGSIDSTDPPRSRRRASRVFSPSKVGLSTALRVNYSVFLSSRGRRKRRRASAWRFLGVPLYVLTSGRTCAPVHVRSLAISVSNVAQIPAGLKIVIGSERSRFTYAIVRFLSGTLDRRLETNNLMRQNRERKREKEGDSVEVAEMSRRHKEKKRKSPRAISGSQITERPREPLSGLTRRVQGSIA